MPKKVTQSLTSVGVYMRPGGQGLVVWSLGDHTLKSHTLTVHAPHPPSWPQQLELLTMPQSPPLKYPSCSPGEGEEPQQRHGIWGTLRNCHRGERAEGLEALSEPWGWPPAFPHLHQHS